jgi:hypothetical protein
MKNVINIFEFNFEQAEADCGSGWSSYVKS